MNFIKAVALAGLTLTLFACGDADRFAVTAPPVSESIRISFAAVEIRDVSLPAYAAADEIHIRSADGTLVSSKATLGRCPERAIALELSENLSRLTNRRIASEPWPFEAYPDARVDIRFSELLASAEGQFTASGQYFVAVLDGRRERSGLFNLAVMFDPKGGPAAIAAARGQLVLDLAKFVARNGLK